MRSSSTLRQIPSCELLTNHLPPKSSRHSLMFGKETFALKTALILDSPTNPRKRSYGCKANIGTRSFNGPNKTWAFR